MPTQIDNKLIYIPSEEEAPKSVYNGEIWYFSKTPLKKICELNIDSEMDCNIDYKYGKIQRWNYTPDVKLNDARSIKEFEKILAKKFPNKAQRHQVAVSMHQKEVKQEQEALKREQELKKDPRLHVVVNPKCKIVFKGNVVECEEYEEEHNQEQFLTVPIQTFNLMSEEDIREHFADKMPKGLNIEFKEENGLYNLKVKVPNSDKIITEEKSLNKEELKDSILNLRQIFKIKKVEEVSND